MTSISPEARKLHARLRAIAKQGSTDLELQPLRALRAAMNKQRLAMFRMHEVENSELLALERGERIEEDEARDRELDEAESAALVALVKVPCGGHPGYVWKMDYLSVITELDWGNFHTYACSHATDEYRMERESGTNKAAA